MNPKRLVRLSKMLPELSLRAVLISNLTNIRYLTGLKMTSALLLVTRKGSVLFVDARYAEMASKNAGKSFAVADPALLRKHLARYRFIGCEEDNVTLSRMKRWKTQHKNTKFVQLSGLVEGLRNVKDSQEISAIAGACAITKKALQRIPSFLTYGMTERDLALKLYVYCMKQGAEAMAFETIVAFGENTSVPHHRPTDRRLKKGDIVQIDMGAMFSGYCSDYSRVYFTQDPTPKQLHAYTALKKAKKAAQALVKSGVLNTDLDSEARRILKLYGYDSEFSHSLGHGVGMDIHEGTTLSARASPTKLRKNEVITIEPGLYFKGKWGMRIEDTMVVS